jgi:hypothetical protein
MAIPKQSKSLQVSQDNPFAEVLILADVIGKWPTTLAEVMKDFIEIVEDPILTGGFAMAHHGNVRATTDIDVICVGSSKKWVQEFQSRGYTFESMQLPIGHLELLTKANKGVDFIHLNDNAFLRSINQRAVRSNMLIKPVRVVSLEDLILLKNLAVKGRAKDQDAVDLKGLLKFPFDAQYVTEWKAKLGITT